MQIHKGKKRGIPTTQIYWPENPEILREHSRTTPLTIVMYAEECILEAFADIKPYNKELYTSIIPLDQSEEELLSRMDAKSCRYELRKSEKLGYSHATNQFIDEAFTLFQDFFESNGYRDPLTSEEWNGYLKIADIHTIRHGTTMIAAHVILRDAPHRVRLLLSATANRNTAEIRNVIGSLNRRLHWCEILFYKKQGYREYDFGGILVDTKDPMFSITQFKNSFGGTTRKEYKLFIIPNPFLRWVVNSLGFIKSRAPSLLKMMKF